MADCHVNFVTRLRKAITSIEIIMLWFSFLLTTIHLMDYLIINVLLRVTTMQRFCFPTVWMSRLLHVGHTKQTWDDGNK